ncbi:creatininase family protein [Allocoleopsis sp.]|uniref:creatininase family protein n=1 Tax=Allocoleopsis sp. TaxID=3088169 RepID=UPI002FCEFCB2
MHGFIPPDRFFPYLTWTDIQAMPDKENVVIIQPLGSIEQHGPHLPIIVDSAIAAAVLGKALSKLHPTIPAYALPPLYYGKSNEHWHFPGTITLSAQTLLAVLTEMAESIYRAGFRKLVLMNAHGGQLQVMEIAARDIHQKYEDFLIFPLFIWRVPNMAKELLTPKELEYGIHAGDGETSLLLSILPEQVKMERAVAEYPQELPQDSLLSMEGKLPFAWVTRDLTQSGVMGDATVATKEKGDRLLESLGEGWVKAIEDVYKFRQPQAWMKSEGRSGGGEKSVITRLTN